MVLLPTLFPGSRVALGPKHSTSLPSSAGVSVVLSVDVKEVALVPNPAPGVAVKASFLSLGPQFSVDVERCARVQRLLLPPTLQMVVPLPFTVHLKVMVPPGQVGGAGMNCPATLPGENGFTLCQYAGERFPSLHIYYIRYKCGYWYSGKYNYTTTYLILALISYEC